MMMLPFLNRYIQYNIGFSQVQVSVSFSLCQVCRVTIDVTPTPIQKRLSPIEC